MKSRDLFEERKGMRISALVIMVGLYFFLAMIIHQASFAVSLSGNNTQVSTSSSTSTIVITFDLPTAAVVTFVLVLLGLAAGLLLMQRFSYADRVVVE
jgi:hypothetical protein